MESYASAALKLVVLYGGESPEREISLASGRCVAGALQDAGHDVSLIDPAETAIETFNWHDIDHMEEEEKVAFIIDNFFKTKWTKEYTSKVIGDIKKLYPKKQHQTEEQKPLIKALNEALDKALKELNEN